MLCIFSKATMFFKVKGSGVSCVNVKRCVEAGTLIDFDALAQQNEELDHGSIYQPILKELTNALVLFIYSQYEDDKKMGEIFARELGKLIERKELSNTK